VTNKEAAFGGTVFVEFVAYQPRQKCRKLQRINLTGAICLGIVLTLRLLSSRALSFKTIDRK
jgi:hypothetical protein